MPATGQVLSTRPAVDHGHRPESYDAYIAGRILRAFDHRRCGSTARDRPSALSHYTQSRLTVNRCMTARLDVTPKTTEQNRIVRTL